MLCIFLYVKISNNLLLQYVYIITLLRVFFSWRHTRTILGRPIWICYLTDHANSRFFFNFRFFFYCIRCFERWPIFGGKIRCVFYPAAKKTEIQGMRKKSTPVEVLFTFRRRIVCRCATKYENSH